MFEIRSIEPKQVYDLAKLSDSDILDINQKLNPRSIGTNEILDYRLDGGTYLHIVMNLPLDMEITLISVPIPAIGIVVTITTQLASSAQIWPTENYSSLLTLAEISWTSPFQFCLRRPPMQLSSLCRGIPIDTGTVWIHRWHISPANNLSTPEFSHDGEMFFPLRVIGFSTSGITGDFS